MLLLFRPAGQGLYFRIKYRLLLAGRFIAVRTKTEACHIFAVGINHSLSHITGLYYLSPTPHDFGNVAGRGLRLGTG